MDADEEYERDNEYYPDGWLSEYEDDSKAEGLKLIERMRAEKSDDFYNALISVTCPPKSPSFYCRVCSTF
jgi:hypothetical protein